MYEKAFKIIKYQENANENHSKISPHVFKDREVLVRIYRKKNLSPFIAIVENRLKVPKTRNKITILSCSPATAIGYVSKGKEMCFKEISVFLRHYSQ